MSVYVGMNTAKTGRFVGCNLCGDYKGSTSWFYLVGTDLQKCRGAAERPRGQTEIERHFNYFHLQTLALLRVTCDIAVNNLNFTSELVATCTTTLLMSITA